MNIFKSIAAVIAALGIVAAMTSPDLADATAAQQESPAILRTGVVADIVEADNITVKVSGSNVLVQAAYTFPQYMPLLGDLVVIAKQDAQWFVLGTQSGPNISNAANSSFELGAGTGDPTSWTSVNDTVTAGAPTTNHTLNTFALDGNGFTTVQLLPTGLGAAVTRLVSSRVPADPGTRWAAAAFTWITEAGSNTAVQAEVLVRFLDSGGATLSLNTLSIMRANSRQAWWNYNRLIFDSSVTAPADTAFVTLELLSRFSVTTAATQAGIVFWDRAILRGPV